jgi:hypothetical protein
VSELGEEARELMRAGRAAHRPTSLDRERIAQALRSRIHGESGGSGVPSAIAGPRGSGWLIPTAVVVGLVAGGFVIASAVGSGQTKTPPPRASASVPAPPVVSPPALSVHSVPSAASSAERQLPSAREGAPSRTRQQASDQLAEEVEILSRAQTELRARRFAGALRVLEGHARKFPRGALAQERIAARIQALCGLGRRNEASSELARLSPGSLHERRAREACGRADTPAAD